jgi:hypothetical protein
MVGWDSGCGWQIQLVGVSSGSCEVVGSSGGEGGQKVDRMSGVECVCLRVSVCAHCVRTLCVYMCMHV